MLRQLLISLIVVVAAAGAFVFFVPGAPAMLAKYGIIVPGAEAVAQPNAGGAPGPQGGQPGAAPGGQRPGGGPGGPPRGRQMVVDTGKVTTAKINDKLNALGEGTAAKSVTVIAPASGTLAELLVKPGEAVQAGAVIGHLDSDADTIAEQRAKLALQDAQASADRTAQLARANNATTVQVSASQLALDNAKLALQAAQLALSKRTITTPISGAVGLFQVSPGNTVTAQTVVTTIEDTSHLLVNFWVPERYAPAISVGMPVTAEAAALPGVAIHGEVSAIDNRIDPTSRTLAIEASIPNENGTLKPGMSFSVTMTFPGQTYPQVDPLAIQWGSSGAYVWKFADGKVDKVAVEIIQRNSDGVLVKGDLNADDQVVTQGVQQLTAGASVRLLNDNGAPPAGAPAGGPRAGGNAQANVPGGNTAGQGAGGQPPARN